MIFKPKLDILPEPQQRFWPELKDTPPEFTLYGGTGVALHLGHRDSVDFDFFSKKEFDPDFLYRTVPYLEGAQILQQGKNTLLCSIDRDGPIKVSYFGVPKLKVIEEAHEAPDNGLRIASLIDLAGMKAVVVQRRAEAKDFIDLDAIMREGIGLPTAIAAATHIYGDSYNPQLTLKALSHYGDGDLHKIPDDMRNRIAKAVAAVDLDHLPEVHPENGNDHEVEP